MRSQLQRVLCGGRLNECTKLSVIFAAPKGCDGNYLGRPGVLENEAVGERLAVADAST